MTDQDPKVCLVVGPVKTLADVLRWTELAEAIGIADGSEVTVNGPTRSMTVLAPLAETELDRERPAVRCHDVACVLGDHESDWSHFDGRSCW